MSLGEQMHADGYEVLIKNVGDGYTAYLRDGGKIEYGAMPLVIEKGGMHWVQVRA